MPRLATNSGKAQRAEHKAFFHVISRDKGFDPLISHLKANKIFAGRWESIGEIPIVKNANQKSSKEKAEIFVAKLREPKVTRPRTEQTLSRALKAHFRESLDEKEVPLVIRAIQASGFLSINADTGKVTYAAADS